MKKLSKLIFTNSYLRTIALIVIFVGFFLNLYGQTPEVAVIDTNKIIFDTFKMILELFGTAFLGMGVWWLKTVSGDISAIKTELATHIEKVNNHDKRIEKIEEKVFE